MATIREEIRLALGALLTANGFTVLATNEKWNKYTTKDAFPLCKVVADGPSRVLKEYAHRRKLRGDEFTVYVAPWNSSQDFEAVTSEVIEQLDSAIGAEDVKANLSAALQNLLGKVAVGECLVLIPDASGETSTPYAMLKAVIQVEYLTPV